MSLIHSYNNPQTNMSPLPSDRDMQYRKAMPVGSFGYRHVDPSFRNPLAQRVEGVKTEVRFPYLSSPSNMKGRSKKGVNSGKEFEALKARIKREASLRKDSVGQKVIPDRVIEEGSAAVRSWAMASNITDYEIIKKISVDLAVNKKRMDLAIDFMRSVNPSNDLIPYGIVLYYEALINAIIPRSFDGVSSAEFAKLLDSLSTYITHLTQKKSFAVNFSVPQMPFDLL